MAFSAQPASARIILAFVIRPTAACRARRSSRTGWQQDRGELGTCIVEKAFQLQHQQRHVGIPRPGQRPGRRLNRSVPAPTCLYGIFRSHPLVQDMEVPEDVLWQELRLMVKSQQRDETRRRRGYQYQRSQCGRDFPHLSRRSLFRFFTSSTASSQDAETSFCSAWPPIYASDAAKRKILRQPQALLHLADLAATFPIIKRPRRPPATACHKFRRQAGPLKHGAPDDPGSRSFQRRVKCSTGLLECHTLARSHTSQVHTDKSQRRFPSRSTISEIKLITRLKVWTPFRDTVAVIREARASLCANHLNLRRTKIGPARLDPINQDPFPISTSVTELFLPEAF
jgi:hypothetical protein